jgi:hypothetical protein
MSSERGLQHPRPEKESSLALLRGEEPRFVAGTGPVDGVFTDDVDEMSRWVHHLDRSCVAIQGPPGTGKTYCGSHMIRSLLDSGRRVGVATLRTQTHRAAQREPGHHFNVMFAK